MKPTETQLEKIIKPKFYGVSNVELVRRINEAPDFGWDDEGCELSRRMKMSEGKFVCKMNYNTLEIIKDEK